MANRRMLSKNISTSRKVNRLNDRAALLYTWLIPHTDDYGRLEGDAFSIKAKIVPMRILNEEQIEEDLAAIEKNGLVKGMRSRVKSILRYLISKSFKLSEPTGRGDLFIPILKVS